MKNKNPTATHLALCLQSPDAFMDLAPALEKTQRGAAASQGRCHECRRNISASNCPSCKRHFRQRQQRCETSEVCSLSRKPLPTKVRRPSWAQRSRRTATQLDAPFSTSPIKHFLVQMQPKRSKTDAGQKMERLDLDQFQTSANRVNLVV